MENLKYRVFSQRKESVIVSRKLGKVQDMCYKPNNNTHAGSLNNDTTSLHRAQN